MACSEAEIREKLRSLFSFANLHKWCDQLNEMVTEFLEQIDEDDRPRIHAILKNCYTERSETKEQLILSLVLMSRLGEQTRETTARLYQLLQGRIDINDQSFLRVHFFRNQHPLPEAIAYDISSRRYFSFKRAISRGMKVESVMSSFDSQAIALYLTIILCRVDLNGQNRAMLSFLLSRIDTDLPEVVITGVFSYLERLKDIIADIEGRGDSALSDEFRFADEPEIEQRTNTIEPDSQSGSQAVYDPKISTDSGIGKREREIVRSNVTVPKSVAGTHTVDEPGDVDREKFPATARTPGATPGSVREGTVPSPGVRDDKLGDPPQAVLVDNNRGESDLVTNPAHDPDDTPEIDSQRPPSVAAGQTRDKLHVTRFTRNTEKLKSILEEIDIPDEAPTPVEDRQAEPVTAGQKKRVRRRTAVWKVLAGALLGALFIGLYLFIAAGSNGDGNSAPESEQPAPVQTETVIQPPEFDHSADTDGGFLITTSDGSALWTVGDGEVLWLVYLAARGGGAGSRNSFQYTIPPDVSWGEFVTHALTENPDVDQFDLIYPDQKITLPIY